MGAAIKRDPSASARPSRALFLDGSIVLKHSFSFICCPLPSCADGPLPRFPGSYLPTVEQGYLALLVNQYAYLAQGESTFC